MKHAPSATAAIAAVLFLASSARASKPAGVQPTYREIKDWILACDNGGTCVAKFVLDDMAAKSSLPDTASPGFLSITREAGPDGRLTILTQSMADSEHAKFDPSKMELDGKPFATDWSTLADGDLVLQDEDAKTFVARVGDGKILTFVNNDHPQSVSLSGLKAVLLAMDDAQGRVGTVTALSRAGVKPASAVPPAPAIPTLVVAPAAATLDDAADVAAKVRAHQAAALKAHGCDSDASQDAAYALNSDETLVVLYCRMAAYQGSVLLYRAPRASPQTAKLVVLPTQPTLKAGLNNGEYVEGEWDAKTATFTESAKGRGLADCGISTQWAFDGKAFQVASFNRQERCGGPPGDWPVLFRSQVKPQS
jgi:hypothetical protein